MTSDNTPVAALTISTVESPLLSALREMQATHENNKPFVVIDCTKNHRFIQFYGGHGKPIGIELVCDVGSDSEGFLLKHTYPVQNHAAAREIFGELSTCPVPHPFSDLMFYRKFIDSPEDAAALAVKVMREVMLLTETDLLEIDTATVTQNRSMVN